MTAGRTEPVPPTTVPPTSRGVIALLEDNCTVCMLCVRECPDWCVSIDSHTETVAPEGGGRARQTYVLDRFAIDFGLCMYCGICVDVCPFDALFWAPTYDYAERQLVDLLHEAPRLGEWLAAVPALPVGSKSGAGDVGQVRTDPAGAGLDAP